MSDEEETIKLIRVSNWDYPFWDYNYATAGATVGAYTVGANNVATRAISKLFVSKETLFIADADTYLWINDARSIRMYLVANVPTTFRGNIYAVFYQRVGQSDTHVHIYFEGTEPQETRGAK